MPEKNNKKKLMVSALIIAGVIILISLSALFIMHFYISKINIVKDSGTVTETNPDAADKDMAEDDYGKEATPEELNKMQNDISKNVSDKDLSRLYDGNLLNILVIGGDTRISGKSGRSDSMVLLSINKSTGKIGVISFMRDIYLKIPGYGYNRLNAAYAYGGAQLLIDTIKLNFKVNIEKYVEFDFYSFIEFVDALGGVTVQVKESDLSSINESVKEVDHYLGADPSDSVLTKGGLLHLNGKQTLGHVRNRDYVNGDFTRTENQREVVKELSSKMFKLKFSEANDLLCRFLPKITTNLSESEIMAILVHLPEYSKYQMNQLGIPVSNAFSYVKINGMSVLKLDFSRNIDTLLSTIYN